MNTTTADTRTGLAAGLCLILVTCLVYFQVTGFGFINLDDNAYVSANKWVHEGLTLPALSWAVTTFTDPYYMPITRISYLIDATLFGVEAGAFHAVNLALHLLNSLLLLALLLRMTGRVWPAAAVAILFAIHPQHVETVAWVAQRKELLAACLGLGSLGTYLLHSRRERPANGSDRSLYYLSLLLFMLSLLSKPTWIVYPLLLLLVDWWPLQRFTRSRLPSLLLEKLPFALVAGAITVLHMHYAALDADHIINTAGQLTLLQRLGNIPAIYLLYLTDTFVPLRVSLYQPYPGELLPATQVLTGSALLLGVTLAAARYAIRRPYLLFGWLWFVIGLLPVTGIIPAGESVLLGDRWTYMPHIGLFIAIVWLLWSFHYPPGMPRHAATGCAALLLALLCYQSWSVAAAWRSSGHYWQRSVEHTQNNHYAHWMLGSHFEDQDQYARALEHYLRAFELRPAEPYYALGLGNLYLHRLHEPAMAWESYRKLLSTAPARPLLLMQMGKSLLHRRELERAESFLRSAAGKIPTSPQELDAISLAHLYLGLLQASDSEWPAVRRHFRQFLTGYRGGQRSNCEVAYAQIESLGMRWTGEERFPVLVEFCG